MRSRAFPRLPVVLSRFFSAYPQGVGYCHTTRLGSAFRAAASPTACASPSPAQAGCRAPALRSTSHSSSSSSPIKLLKNESIWDHDRGVDTGRWTYVQTPTMTFSFSTVLQLQAVQQHGAGGRRWGRGGRDGKGGEAVHAGGQPCLSHTLRQVGCAGQVHWHAGSILIQRKLQTRAHC